MEQRNNLVLHGTETFSRGALDNVALESGAVVLDSSAGRYLPYGSYTTPEFAMPAFCNLNVSWNASAPHNTMVEVRCRVYAGNTWTGWLSFGKWAPDYPRCSIKAQSEDGLVFLMGDTVTVATPGGGTGIQLQVNRSTNDDKATPAVRLLAAAARPLAWEKHNGHPLNRRLYLPEYCLSAHDPSFGREMDLPLVMAADEPLRRGYPARRSCLRHGGQSHQLHRQCRLCGCCGGLLRLPLLAGLDGSGRPARPDPR